MRSKHIDVIYHFARERVILKDIVFKYIPTNTDQAPTYYEVQLLPRRHGHEASASLARFRCSCHDLRVERDRHLPVAVKPPRHLRTCLLCANDSVQDERHMVFDCPLYAPIRFQFADLFSTRTTLNSFLEQNQDRVARFIHACFELRSRTAHMSLAGSEKALSL